MPSFINISAYRFAPLEGLRELQALLREVTHASAIRGTILLSPEGINLFVAGSREAVDILLQTLRAIPALADLAAKESESDGQPFNRMLVKIKQEIIAFGVPGIDPSRRTSPKLSPRTLQQWLREGRPVTLLDTRNDYEIRVGTFRGARAAGIDHFRDFPAAVGQLPEAMKTQPVVMFCTGGIRCEKAGPFMEQAGFSEIHQLDGGILKYFEECGGDFFDGECFVFDRRVGVDSSLRATGAVLCRGCQLPVTVAEQLDPRYVAEVSCPQCAGTAEAADENRC